MLPNIVIASFIKRTMLRAAKLPIIYLAIGIILIALSYTDTIFPLAKWQYLFDLTDEIGEIFIAVALATFIYNFIVLLCHWYEKRFADKNHITTILVASFRKGLRIIFVLVLINILIAYLAPSQFYLLLANNIINTIIIGALGWLVIQILYTYEAMVYQYMLKRTSHDHIRIKAWYTRTHIIRNIATVLIVVVTIAAILMSYSSVRNIGISLLASAGFLTAIIGLSAQRSLVSLFSGLQIALSHSIKMGDVVLIENNAGIIEEITFTYVTLKLADRRRLIVPINYFTEKPFENWSQDVEGLRSSVHIHADFLLPIQPLREELNRILKNSSFWDGKASKLEVANLDERTVKIRFQISAANADDLSELSAEVKEKILSFIRENYAEHFPKVRLGSE